MMVRLLLFFLFIGGFSIAQDEETAEPDETTKPDNNTKACTYNTTEGLHKYDCFPEGHCKEVVIKEVKRANIEFVFACDAESHKTEMTLAHDGSNDNKWSDAGDKTCEGASIKSHEDKQIRCRKKRGCGLADYYDTNQCTDPRIGCEMPIMTQGRSTKKVVGCTKEGTLEAYFFSNWIQVAENDAIFCTRGEFRQGSSVTVIQLMRCKLEACNLAIVPDGLNDSCLGEKCTQIRTRGTSMECDSGYDLEGYDGKVWSYLNGYKQTRCVGSNIAENFEKYRCRKERGCDIASLFHQSSCGITQHCENVVGEDTYKCKDGQLEYTAVGAAEDDWNEEYALNCDRDETGNRLRILSNDVERLNVIPSRIRCMIEKECEVKYFYEEGRCDDDTECYPPTNTLGALVCDAGYGLQALLQNGSWIDASKVLCKDLKFTVYSLDKTKLDDYPTGFRCIRKRIEQFFDSHCGPDDECEMPKNCESLTCPTAPSSVQIRANSDANWRDVESARCDSTHFRAKLTDGTSLVEHSPRIRCVRKKCSGCNHPCREKCQVAAATLLAPTKWTGCAHFTCGPHSKLIINEKMYETSQMECVRPEELKQLWNVQGSVIEAIAEQVQCEYSCTKVSPLTSTCKPDDIQCATWTQDDEDPGQCKNKMYFAHGESGAIEISDIRCDKTNAKWKALRKGEQKEQEVPAGSNVYCHEGNCDERRIFPSCNLDYDDSSTCFHYTTVENKFECAEPATFWSRTSSEDKWKEIGDVREVECRGGSIVVNGKAMGYDFQATCREPKPTPSASKVGVYLAVSFVILILIVVIIATIILRVTGNGWIHTVVIKGIHDYKRKRHSRNSGSTRPSFSRTSSNSATLTITSRATATHTPREAGSRTPQMPTQRTPGKAPKRASSSVLATSEDNSKMKQVEPEVYKV